MSKRAGDFISMEELLDEVGPAVEPDAEGGQQLGGALMEADPVHVGQRSRRAASFTRTRSRRERRASCSRTADSSTRSASTTLAIDTPMRLAACLFLALLGGGRSAQAAEFFRMPTQRVVVLATEVEI